jgi:hypothetical protein
MQSGLLGQAGTRPRKKGEQQFAGEIETLIQSIYFQWCSSSSSEITLQPGLLGQAGTGALQLQQQQQCRS